VTFFEEAKSSFAIHFQESTKIQLSGFVTGRLVTIVSEAWAAWRVFATAKRGRHAQ
jgi:hypothetical protein